MRMKQIKRKFILIFLVLCILCTTPNTVYAMPIISESPNWLGWRMNTATWDCIPIAINCAEEAIKSFDNRIEKVSAFTGATSLFASKDIVPSAAGAISVCVLVKEKEQIRKVINKMKECYRQHKSISYKTQPCGDGIVYYRLR